MSFLVTRCVKRSHAVQELYEAWELAHREAMVACDIEELIGEALELCHLFKHGWQTLARSLFDGPPFNYQVVGSLFREAAQRSVTVVHKVRHLAAEAGQRGYTLQGSSQLEIEFRELEKVNKEVEAKWPFIDSNRVAEARAAFQRGDYEAAEDLLHATQGGCSEADK